MIKTKNQKNNHRLKLLLKNQLRKLQPIKEVMEEPKERLA